ncbi:monocarboxylate transporter 12-like [Amphiura filiformis]|uniref:monocarboxylate transporter 12-like n=1 Tax=Amphiura filiformis TaxID=82378 RepID=UPI003B2157C2
MSSSVAEGGWGWIIVASAHSAMLIWDGNVKALAVLLPSLKEQFTSQTWLIGIIIAGLSTVLELTAPIIGAINENFNIDPRYVGVTGGVLSSFAFMAASFSSSTLQLFLFISVIGGIGLGLAFIQSTTLVPRYFDELYPRASGIVTCGTAVGMIIFAPLTQLFLDTYGWRSSLLLVGALNAHLIVTGSLLRPVNQVNASYSTIEPNYIDADTTGRKDTEKGTPFLKKTISAKQVLEFLFPTTIFTDPIYILHLLVFCCSAFVLSGWFIYLVPHAISKGLQPYEAAAISMVSAVVSIIGRLSYFPLVERDIVKIRSLMYAGSALSAVALLVDPWMKTFWSLTISSSAYFLGRGVFKSLFFVILKGNIGAEHFASGFGWCVAIGGIFRFIAGGVVGWLYDYTGHYDYGFLVLGGVECLGIFFLFVEDMYRNTRLQKK